MVVLVTLLGIQFCRGGAWDTPAVHVCGVVICGLGLGALVLQSWQDHLLASWKKLDLFICGECGALRNLSPSRQCPACGTDRIPAFPGQLPSSCARWQRVCNSLATGGPAAVVGLVLLTGI